MYFLTYISRAAKGLDPKEIQQILEKAQHHNAKHNLSGLLLFRSGLFFQFLEGDKKDVLQLFEKIASDRRHENIEVLFELLQPDQPRIFPTWKMGYISDRLANIEQERLIQSLHSTVSTAECSKEKVLHLLKDFAAYLPNSAQKILLRKAS